MGILRSLSSVKSTDPTSNKLDQYVNTGNTPGLPRRLDTARRGKEQVRQQLSQAGVSLSSDGQTLTVPGSLQIIQPLSGSEYDVHTGINIPRKIGNLPIPLVVPGDLSLVRMQYLDSIEGLGVAGSTEINEAYKLTSIGTGFHTGESLTIVDAPRLGWLRFSGQGELYLRQVKDLREITLAPQAQAGQLQPHIRSITVLGTKKLASIGPAAGYPTPIIKGGDFLLRKGMGITSVDVELHDMNNVSFYKLGNLQALPKIIGSIRGDLDLTACKSLRELPADLVVNGNVYLRDCEQLQAFPTGWRVGGYVDVQGATKLLKRYLPNAPIRYTIKAASMMNKLSKGWLGQGGALFWRMNDRGMPMGTSLHQHRDQIANQKPLELEQPPAQAPATPLPQILPRIPVAMDQDFLREMYQGDLDQAAIKLHHLTEHVGDTPEIAMRRLHTKIQTPEGDQLPADIALAALHQPLLTAILTLSPNEQLSNGDDLTDAAVARGCKEQDINPWVAKLALVGADRKNIDPY